MGGRRRREDYDGSACGRGGKKAQEGGLGPWAHGREAQEREVGGRRRMEWPEVIVEGTRRREV